MTASTAPGGPDRPTAPHNAHTTATQTPQPATLDREQAQASSGTTNHRGRSPLEGRVIWYALAGIPFRMSGQHGQGRPGRVGAWCAQDSRWKHSTPAPLMYPGPVARAIPERAHTHTDRPDRWVSVCRALIHPRWLRANHTLPRLPLGGSILTTPQTGQTR